jgi:hypothetical protein
MRRIFLFNFQAFAGWKAKFLLVLNPRLRG